MSEKLSQPRALGFSDAVRDEPQIGVLAQIAHDMLTMLLRRDHGAEQRRVPGQEREVIVVLCDDLIQFGVVRASHDRAD